MHSDERETRHIMIKAYLFAPTMLVMAASALLSFLPRVHIIDGMTAVAAGIELFMVQVARVAGGTTHIHMLAQQRESGLAAVVVS